MATCVPALHVGISRFKDNAYGRDFFNKQPFLDCSSPCPISTYVFPSMRGQTKVRTESLIVSHQLDENNKLALTELKGTKSLPSFLSWCGTLPTASCSLLLLHATDPRAELKEASRKIQLNWLPQIPWTFFFMLEVDLCGAD
ncbi:unnamed protein product [Linum trigynum]|uniref:Uncharacterized protein n=1 Tax=Linum trigynum TaxID=586398 RepID=A0AAV2E625_9ROSI